MFREGCTRRRRIREGEGKEKKKFGGEKKEFERTGRGRERGGGGENYLRVSLVFSCYFSKSYSENSKL